MIKKILAALLLAAILIGALDAWSYKDALRYRDQVAVLMYHHVHDTDQSSSTVSTALFRDQLNYLKSKGYHFISLSEFKQFYDGGAVPDKAVLVTFDDGYKSFYDYAYPILKELDVPAVNFVVTKDLDDPLAPSIPALSRDQIRQMLSERPGRYDFQCHSNNLHFKEGKTAAITGPLTREDGAPETPEQAVARVAADTKACAQRLNELYGSDHAADSYAYPFGIHSKTAQDLLTQAGFRYAFTIVNEMATRANPKLEIPRINAGNPAIRPELLDKQIMLRVESVKPFP